MVIQVTLPRLLHHLLCSGSATTLRKRLDLIVVAPRAPVRGNTFPSDIEEPVLPATGMLPIETLEGVIDQARDDTATLHHLSVTCRAFLPRVRYHLFSYMLIQTVQQTESFRDFLDSCPWVLPLVQNISLSTFLSIDNATPNIRLLDVVPAHLLSRLPNLRTWNMELRGSKSGPETVTASLSLNRLTLSCYQRYGSGIRNLELASIPFQDVSDFIGLVSAFTCLESLTCSCIGFRTAQRYVVSSHGNSETNARAKLLPIKRLHVSIKFINCLAAEKARSAESLDPEGWRIHGPSCGRIPAACQPSYAQ